MPNKIAIDISPLNDGNSKRGMGFYVRNLVSALKAENNKNFDIDFIENSKLKNKKYDLIHYPYFDPFFLTLPTSSKTPFVITVPDIIPIQYSKHFPVGLKGKLKWLIQKSRAKKSELVITISHTSKYAIIDHLKYPSDKIYVTYLAASESFYPIKDKKILEKTKQKYHLPDKFVLYVGDVNWNKNIPSLVKACIELDYPLVIVGSSATKPTSIHPWTKDLVWVQNCSYPKLTLTGFVPDDELNHIYNLATMYCQPSFAEGFGLTPVEAMKAGCPVAYSQDSCLPEIMDFNGLFFDPFSLDQIKTTLKKFWENEKLRQEFSKLGQIRATNFSWQQTAKQTLAIYQTAIDLHEQR